jgi:hypothetical protein
MQASARTILPRQKLLVVKCRNFVYWHVEMADAVKSGGERPQRMEWWKRGGARSADLIIEEDHSISMGDERISRRMS